MQWTVLEALNWTQEYLKKHGENNPRLSAQWLLEHATDLERIELYTHFDAPLREAERATLRESIKRRINGEPLQYIQGKAAFRHLEFKVRPGVLIPRPETELLVDLVLDFIKPQKSAKILELCTGTGCIALSLLHEHQHCCVIATDIAPAAVELCQLNSCELNLDADNRLRILQDDLAASLLSDPGNHGNFAVVVANPPYIPSALLATLPSEVAKHEPQLALDGGADGLDLFRVIISQAAKLLKPAGLLACELHQDSLESAAALLQNSLYSNIQIHPDLTGRNRFISATKR